MCIVNPPSSRDDFTARAAGAQRGTFVLSFRHGGHSSISEASGVQFPNDRKDSERPSLALRRTVGVTTRPIACEPPRMRKIAILGSGDVGQALARGFLAKGDAVMRGSREPAKLANWKGEAGPNASTGTFAEAAKWGDVIVLAVKGTAAEAVVSDCGGGLDGKVVIDATNPIADAAPTDGVLQFFTGPNDSLMERLQKKAPAAKFVKAFSSVGNAMMVDPNYGGTKPTMFICGNDEGAKATVKSILERFGWESCDAGTATAARAIEPLCMLWCIPGFRENSWTHAFKLLRK
jgi:predicted dinucleotide-binding enzyme